LIVGGRGAAGWIKEKVRIDYDGKDVRFKARPGFLMETLDLLDEAIIGKSKLKLEGENFIHVVNLLVG